MLASIPKTIEPVMPTKKEIALAEESGLVLASYLKSTKTVALQLLKKGRAKQEIVLPASAIRLLIAILAQMAEGNTVTLMPIHAELTTQEAADLLNVSRPYLVNLLEEGKIPYRKVGSRRRVLAKDVLDYRAKLDQKRLRTLEKLSKQAQELNMGY